MISNVVITLRVMSNLYPGFRMADLKSSKLIYLKGVLFLIAGVVSAGLIVARTLDWQIAILLTICIWCFCRFYYFAFYVIEHYVDDEFRFSGLIDFARHLINRERS